MVTQASLKIVACQPSNHSTIQPCNRTDIFSKSKICYNQQILSTPNAISSDSGRHRDRGDPDTDHRDHDGDRNQKKLHWVLIESVDYSRFLTWRKCQFCCMAVWLNGWMVGMQQS